MSVNLARRAKAMQKLHLPDDVYIPDTTYLGSYRKPNDEKYAEHPSKMSMRPVYDDKLRGKSEDLGITDDTIHPLHRALHRFIGLP